MKVAVVGATGLVGSKMLEVLEQRKFPVSELIPVASEKSEGKQVRFGNAGFRVVRMEEALQLRPDIALFSAGGSVSLQWAPRFADLGTIVIDNSSAWRMNPEIKLVVPEINAGVITGEDKIIANPNCSTIQMVMVLYPLHRRYRIKRIVVSTYQSVTGTGAKAVRQLSDEREGVKDGAKAYPWPIDLNIIPQIDVFVDNGYTKEEMKMINETRKILAEPNLAVTSTTVRIPVTGGHSESVNVEFEEDFDLSEVRSLISGFPGLVLQDAPEKSLYPMPLFAMDKDEVFVGRLRRDESIPRALNMWIVADNLRKGAATNAVQIAEHIRTMKQGN